MSARGTLFVISAPSGTGKTTTTFTTQNDSLAVQDDFVALMPGGKVFGTENGCFAKTFGLDPDFEPNIFIYDNYPGGIGQSAPLHKMTRKLLEHAADLLAHCPCESGCPSCVGPAGEIGDRGKEAAARFLRELLAGV